MRSNSLKIEVSKGIMSVKKARTGSLIILTFQERVRANLCESPESHHWCKPILIAAPVIQLTNVLYPFTHYYVTMIVPL